MRRWLLIAVVVAPLAGLVLLFALSLARTVSTNPGNFATYDSSGEATVLRSEPPEFTLNLFDGGGVRLADLRGQVVLLDFWGSWCGPCRAEAPELQKVWTQYRDKGVAFVGINVFDVDASAKAFLREFGITYPSGPDPKGAIAVDYGLTGVPEKFLISRDGRILHKFVGPQDAAALGTVLDQMLAMR